MSKILINIDVTKVPKENVVERRYTNKAGHEVEVKELKFEIVELNKKRHIKDGDTWSLYETHFVSLPKKNKDDETVYVGKGVQFESRNNDEPPF